MAGIVFFGTLGKFTWRMCAAVLSAQSIAVFFGALVARGIAVADSSRAATAYRWSEAASRVLCVIAAGAMRSPFGVTLGWLIQVATFAATVIVPPHGPGRRHLRGAVGALPHPGTPHRRVTARTRAGVYRPGGIGWAA